MKHLKDLSAKTNGFNLSCIGTGTMRMAADQQAGRDTDKMKETKLTHVLTQVGNSTYKEAQVVVEYQLFETTTVKVFASFIAGWLIHARLSEGLLLKIFPVLTARRR